MKDFLYHFILVIEPTEEQLMTCKAGYCGKPDDNAILVYCYYDEMCGINYRVICCAHLFEGGGVNFSRCALGDIKLMLTYRQGALSGRYYVFPNEEMPEFQEEADMIKESYGFFEV